MTDKELIEALRWCVSSDEFGCFSCPGKSLCDVRSGKVLLDIADRFEALIAERDHFRDLTKKLWCEKQYGEDMNVPTTEEKP